MLINTQEGRMKKIWMMLKAISLVWKNKKALLEIKKETLDLYIKAKILVAEKDFSAEKSQAICEEVIDVVEAIQKLKW